MGSALTYLGFARKKGAAGLGTEGARTAVQNGSARVVLLAADASDNAKKRMTDACHHYRVTLLQTPSAASELGGACGKAPLAAVAVTDPHLAEAILKVEEDAKWQSL